MSDEAPDPPESDEVEEVAFHYPVEGAPPDEVSRAWVLALFCGTASGPIFDTLPKDIWLVSECIRDGLPGTKLKVAK